MRKSSFGLVLVTALVLLLVIAARLGADGSIGTPGVCEVSTSWKIVYNHENAPSNGAAANAIVRVEYLSPTNKVLDSEDINIAGAEFSTFLAAQTAPATGENAGWSAGRKKLFRMSTWLVANGKLTKCATCTVVG